MGKECLVCMEKRTIHYNDKVEIIGGFFKGQIGRAHQEDTSERYGTTYDIEIKRGSIIRDVACSNLKKIEERKSGK